MMNSIPVVAGAENVVISSAACSVTFVPALGGKIASIKIGGNELLQAPLAPPVLRSQSLAFEDSDASGWDECLPSVAACEVETPSGRALIPDHGDLWRVPWQVLDSAPGSVLMRGECFSLPLALQRSAALTESGNGWHLSLEYTVSNIGNQAVPWSWAAHPLFATQKGDQILLPASITTFRIEGSRGNRLGSPGKEAQWPIATLTGGAHADLSVAQDADAGIGDKLFAGPLSQDENWCTLLRPSAGLRLHMEFDPEATPYLGLWICYGGWPERPGHTQVCVALEPATAPRDSLAVTGPWSRMLGPGESFSWPMQIKIEKL
jgi:galactose mutarotase-like enzyme